jgi:hypothetical protein
MGYTPRYFRETLPAWKREKDPLLTKIFYRPVSFFASSLFTYMGWSANMVSYFSLLIASVACLSFILSYPIVGAILINVWLILDCADGNIARSIRKEKYGDFADAISSYICVGLMFIGIGFAAYYSGGLLIPKQNPIVILLGGLAGSGDSPMRLVYQKFLNSSYSQGQPINKSEDPEQEHGINKIRMKVDGFMSLGGILPIVTLLAAIFRMLDIVVIIWCAYYMLSFVFSTLFLIRKTFILNKEMESEE